MKFKVKRILCCFSTALVLPFFLASCGGDDNKKPKGKFDKFEGFWQLNGGGELLHFSKKNLTTYNYNSYGCVTNSVSKLSESEYLLPYMELSSNGQSFVRDTVGSSDKTYSRKSQLLEVCQNNLLDGNEDALVNFDFALASFQDYYPDFEYRPTDWQGVRSTYRPLVKADTSDTELRDIFSLLFNTLQDGHVGTSVPDNEDLSTSTLVYRGLTLEALRLSFNQGLDGDAFVSNLEALPIANKQLIDSLLDADSVGRFQESSSVVWGSFADRLGYLRIDRMYSMGKDSDLSEGDEKEMIALAESDLKDVKTLMEAFLDLHGDKDAIIVDARFNVGGFDRVSQEIASYFTNQKVDFGTKQIKNATEEGENIVLSLHPPSSQTFTKPVYLLISGETSSAGETFSMAMKSLPNVTVIGQPTWGAISDVTEIKMPNGWFLNLSTEVYRDSTGNQVEGIGITPDVEINPHNTEDFTFFSNTALDYVLVENKVIPNHTPSREELVNSISDELVQSGFVGLAAAVIVDEEVVWQQGFGVEDAKSEEPVTPNTPFNLASITKTFVGTALTQFIETGEIDLDEPINNMGLGFSVVNPNTPEKPITLRQLVTHTSTILDNGAYVQCSYFLVDDQSSLVNKLNEGVVCPEPETEVDAFLQSYFSPEVQQEIGSTFIDQDGVAPGDMQVYSNVGTALAALSVEKKLNISLAEYIVNEILQPLGMNNSFWNSVYSDPEKRAASKYTITSDGHMIALPEYSYATLYDGGLNASVQDLAIYLAAIAGGGERNGVRILEEASIVEMLSPQAKTFTHVFEKQGIFWGTNGSFFGHNGGDPGVSTHMYYNIHTGVGVVLLTNTEDSQFGNSEKSESFNELLGPLYRHGLAHKVNNAN